MQSVFTPDRELVASRFSAAAGVYDCYAEHHRLIASEVLNIVNGINPQSVLELGCGTGILSLGLHRSFPEALKVFTDIAPGMVETCRRKIPLSDLVSHRIWDFERNHCDCQYGLVVSSCALQWLSNPASFVRKLSSLVVPGGVTIHAIPVRGMLGELEQSFSETGGSWNSLNYLSGADWDKLFIESGFSSVRGYSLDFTVYYHSPTDTLRAVRGIGASLSGHSGAPVVSPGALRKALDFYQSEFGDDSGSVPATYRIHFVAASGGFA
ncbi:MAG: methyltransferase domain-containing protein [Candidatus Sabulitectum sp.]|nr:methyltransferase domain-containing protein [Candidatus Sabulitectum sp.]